MTLNSTFGKSSAMWPLIIGLLFVGGPLRKAVRPASMTRRPLPVVIWPLSSVIGPRALRWLFKSSQPELRTVTLAALEIWLPLSRRTISVSAGPTPPTTRLPGTARLGLDLASSKVPPPCTVVVPE